MYTNGDRGTNQHSKKYKNWTMTEKILWVILIMGSIIVYLATHKDHTLNPHVDGYIYQVVYASDTSEKTIQEKVAVESVKEFGPGHADAYMELVFHESSYNPYVVNSIGACGLPQALPCSKMKCKLGDVDCQLSWMSSYIRSRYGTPKIAWKLWQDRASESKSGKEGWY